MRPEGTTVLLFLVLLFSLALLFLLLPQNGFSNAERRSLQTAPRFSLVSLAEGRLGSDVDRWYADQFPFRAAFLRAKCAAELALGKGENNGILLGGGDQLARVRRDDGTDRPDLAHLTEAAAGVSNAARRAKVPAVFLFPGRTVDVAGPAFAYPRAAAQAAETAFRARLDPAVNAPDVTALLREHTETGERTVFRTDHHWTVRGAYLAYRETLRAFGMEGEILPPSAFTPQTLTTSFRGTYAAAGNFPGLRGEPLEIWTRPDDGAYTVTADGRKQDGLYTLPGPGRPIGYEVFPGGTHDVVTVEKTGEDRPRLVVFKDSFANSLVPFLCRHFDLVLLNLSSTRTDHTDLTALSDAYGADRVLVVWSVANLETAEVAARFR